MSSADFAENIITLIEELYLVERSGEEWLKGILHTACQFLDQGAGLGGVLYDLLPGENLNIHQVIGTRVSERWLKVGEQMHSAPEFATDHERVYRTLQCATLQECIRGSVAADVAAELYRNEGIAGVTMINGLSPSGDGCALYIFSPRDDQLSSKKRELLCRLSSHIATANRLRCRLESSAQKIVPTTADAVLSVNGKVECAHGFSARERDCLALALQGHANKSIAYELGLANATVRVLMSRAARKVGAHSRRELLQMCRSLRVCHHQSG